MSTSMATGGFPPEEAKGKKSHRVDYLTDRALAITQRLIALHSILTGGDFGTQTEGPSIRTL